MHLAEKETNEPCEIADFFRLHFSSIYRESIPTSTVQIGNSIDNENVIFSSKEVLKELVPLRDTNDSGPDNISAFLLKRCSSLLLTPCAIYLLYLCGEEFTPIFGKKVLRFLFINREMWVISRIIDQYPRVPTYQKFSTIW